MTRCTVFAAAFALSLAASWGAAAADKVKAVATFSILADMVSQVGGERVEVTTFLGPDDDPHAFEPAPSAAKALSGADILFVNGIGLEGWLERLTQAAEFKGRTVTATKGITTATMVEHEGHHHGGDHDHAHDHADADHDHGDHDHGDHAHEDDAHDGHGEEHDHAHEDGAEEVTDPHAWQSLKNGVTYVENIRDGLIAADPEGKETYEANAAAYIEKIEAEDAAVRAAFADIPEEKRVIVTSHDAFGYFGKAYGVRFLAPEASSGHAEASARDVARIIDQIRKEKIEAVFLENVQDKRLLEQIAAETGARIGGTVYSDALSAPGGPAPTYLDMFRHNVAAFTRALQPS